VKPLGVEKETDYGFAGDIIKNMFDVSLRAWCGFIRMGILEKISQLITLMEIR